MHVDFKITAWERVDIPDEIKDEVMSMLDSGEISTANDIIEKFPEEAVYSGVIDGTGSQMTLTENGGVATIEFYDNPREDPTWTNEIEK